ncbi:MAG: PilW family protein [Burkholderiales bacterium]
MKTRHRAQGGVTLVELLVGMAVALIATLVITQMYANFEGQKRTSVAGSDAQENGLAALFTLERDIRMAGYGLTANPLLTCSNVYSGYDGPSGVVTPAPGLTNTAIMPVRIIEGGANPDQIELVSSASLRPGVPVQIRQAMPSPAGDLKVTNTTGFSVGDVIIVSDGTNCSVMQITQIQSPAGGSGLFGFVHNNGAGAPFNMAGNITNSWPAYGVGANVYQLGQLVSRRYSVQPSANTRALFVQELIPPGTAATPYAADIVDLQAQYGLAAPGSQQVTCWVNATNGGNACDGGNWANPTPAQVGRIRAVRLAVLARSAIAEKPSVAGGVCDTTTTLPGWTGGNFNLSGNWQCYRYRVFETVVPLRNVIWGSV